MTKARAVIWDLDGTLADCNHRRPLIPDWKAFHAGIPKDTPITPMKWLHNQLVHAANFLSKDTFVNLYVTGRPEKYREETLEWLDTNLGMERSSLYLYMRGNEDFRKNHEYKQALLVELREKYEIILAFDDSNKVVDMWRANGVYCLACPDETVPLDYLGEPPQDHA